MLLATWVTIIVSFLRYIVTFLLIRYTEGAVYSSMITSLGNPVGTMFWSLFTLYPNLHWEPKYTKATTYTLVGLAFMTPAVVVYNYISYKEENELLNHTDSDSDGEDYENYQDINFDEHVPNTEDILRRYTPSVTGSVDTDGGFYNL